MSETLTLPREVVDKAIALGERHATALEALDERQAAYQREVKPALDAYADHLRTLKAAHDKTVAERNESRSGFERIATSRPAMAIYGVIVAGIANYLLGISGIAPPEVRAALNTEAAHATP